MLKTLRDLFDSLLPPAADASPQAAEHALQLATAVLLVEVMRADASFHPGEREAVLAALRDKFELSDDEAARLASSPTPPRVAPPTCSRSRRASTSGSRWRRSCASSSTCGAWPTPMAT